MLVIFYFLNSEQTESSHKVSFALSSTVNREFCKGQLYGNWEKKNTVLKTVEALITSFAYF